MVCKPYLYSIYGTLYGSVYGTKYVTIYGIYGTLVYQIWYHIRYHIQYRIWHHTYMVLYLFLLPLSHLCCCFVSQINELAQIDALLPWWLKGYWSGRGSLPHSLVRVQPGIGPKYMYILYRSHMYIIYV